MFFFPIDFLFISFFFLAPSSYHPKSPRFPTLSFSVFCMREIFMNNEVNVQVQNLMYIFLLSLYTFSTISIDFLRYIFILFHLTFCYLLLLWKIIQLFFLLKCTYNTHTKKIWDGEKLCMEGKWLSIFHFHNFHRNFFSFFLCNEIS